MNALAVFHALTEKLNADWRALYRSFYIMHTIYKKLDNKKEAARYATLCKRCNVNFPLL